LDNAISDHMDTIRWSDLLSVNTCLSSGIARLSGPIWDRADRVTQVCHLERIVPGARSPNWPYGRLGRAPLSVPLETTLGAPRGGAKTACERWQDRSVASDDRDPLADNPPQLQKCNNIYIFAESNPAPRRQSSRGRGPLDRLLAQARDPGRSPRPRLARGRPGPGLPGGRSAASTGKARAEDRATRGRDPSADPGAKTGAGGRMPPLGIPGLASMR
jgi:hypothetical protein